MIALFTLGSGSFLIGLTVFGLIILFFVGIILTISD